MILQSVPKGLTPPVVTLFGKLSRTYSSVPALVGFACEFEGKTLKPILNGVQAGSVSPLYVGNVLYKELTYESIAAWLTANDVNMPVTGIDSKLKGNWTEDTFVTSVDCFSLRVTSDMVKKDESNRLILPDDVSMGITNQGLDFWLGTECKSWVIELLFCPRNRTHLLPPEFDGFRLYKDKWLTLGKSFGPVVDVTWQSINDREDSITIKSRSNPCYEQLFWQDVENFKGLLKQGAE